MFTHVEKSRKWKSPRHAEYEKEEAETKIRKGKETVTDMINDSIYQYKSIAIESPLQPLLMAINDITTFLANCVELCKHRVIMLKCI